MTKIASDDDGTRSEVLDTIMTELYLYGEIKSRITWGTPRPAFPQEDREVD